MWSLIGFVPNIGCIFHGNMMIICLNCRKPYYVQTNPCHVSQFLRGQPWSNARKAGLHEQRTITTPASPVRSTNVATVDDFPIDTSIHLRDFPASHVSLPEGKPQSVGTWQNDTSCLSSYEKTPKATPKRSTDSAFGLSPKSTRLSQIFWGG